MGLSGPTPGPSAQKPVLLWAPPPPLPGHLPSLLILCTLRSLISLLSCPPQVHFCPSPCSPVKGSPGMPSLEDSALLPRPGLHCSRGPGQALLQLNRTVSQAHPPPPPSPPELLQQNARPAPATCQGLCGALESNGGKTHVSP